MEKTQNWKSEDPRGEEVQYQSDRLTVANVADLGRARSFWSRRRKGTEKGTM